VDNTNPARTIRKKECNDLRILLSGVNHADNLDHFSTDSIDQDIVWMDHRFARPIYPTGPVEERMIGQHRGACLDFGVQLYSGAKITFSDVSNNVGEIVKRAGTPD
jgi:hypothetical protein